MFKFWCCIEEDSPGTNGRLMKNTLDMLKIRISFGFVLNRAGAENRTLGRRRECDQKQIARVWKCHCCFSLDWKQQKVGNNGRSIQRLQSCWVCFDIWRFLNMFNSKSPGPVFCYHRDLMAKDGTILKLNLVNIVAKIIAVVTIIIELCLMVKLVCYFCFTGINFNKYLQTDFSLFTIQTILYKKRIIYQ